MSKAIPDLPAYDEKTGLANVIIETAKGSRNKFKFDERRGMFRLSRTLPAGTVFPFDFGYLPATEGPDGDPVDVLVLMDEPAFAGCLVPSRLVGVIEAEQTEKGKSKPERNDRLIAIAAYSQEHEQVQDISQLSDSILSQIEHFFESYNEFEGKKFKPIARKGPAAAAKVVKDGQRK
jgi:inorganic pyrophosphatase